MQIRPRDNPSGPAYAPARDIAHLFPKIAQAAAMTLDDSALAMGRWPWRCVERPDNEAIYAAAESYFQMLTLAWQEPTTNIDDLLLRLQAFERDERALTIILTAVGLATTVSYIRGCRDANASADEAQMNGRAIMTAIEIFARRASQPWYVRWPAAVLNPIKGWWRALFPPRGEL